jgi:hypothetical protein
MHNAFLILCSVQNTQKSSRTVAKLWVFAGRNTLGFEGIGKKLAKI